jgi:hypothetical protein
MNAGEVEIRAVRLLYRNHRGEIAIRRVVPKAFRFGGTEWHPEPQWLLEVFDVDKGKVRTLATRDVLNWDPDADDDWPIDHAFMEAEGWYYLDCGVWGYKTADGFVANGEGEYWYTGLQLNTAGQSLQIVADRDRESVEMAVPCKTRGDIRGIHAVFGRRVAQ